MTKPAPTLRDKVDAFEFMLFMGMNAFNDNNLAGERVWDFSKSVLTVTKCVLSLSTKRIQNDCYTLREDWVKIVAGYNVSNTEPLNISDDFKARFLVCLKSFNNLRANRILSDKYMIDTLVQQSGLINVSDDKDADLQNLKLATHFEHYLPHLLKIKEQVTEEMLPKLYNFYRSQPGAFRKDKDVRPKYHLNPSEELLVNDPEFESVLRLVNDLYTSDASSLFLNPERTEVRPEVLPVLAKYGMKAFGKIVKDVPYFYFNLGMFSVPMFNGY